MAKDPSPRAVEVKIITLFVTSHLVNDFAVQTKCGSTGRAHLVLLF